MSSQEGKGVKDSSPLITGLKKFWERKRALKERGALIQSKVRTKLNVNRRGRSRSSTFPQTGKKKLVVTEDTLPEEDDDEDDDDDSNLSGDSKGGEELEELPTGSVKMEPKSQGGEKNKLLQMMSQQFNAAKIDNSVAATPNKGKRAPRITRKRKSEVLDETNKGSENSALPPPQPALPSVSGNIITSALKKVRKESTDTPSSSSNSSPTTSRKTRRKPEKMKTKVTIDDKDSSEDTASISEASEVEYKAEEMSNEKGNAKSRKKGKAKDKALLASQADTDSGTESPVISKGRGRAQSVSADSQQMDPSKPSPSGPRGKGRGKVSLQSNTATPGADFLGKKRGRSIAIKTEPDVSKPKGRGKALAENSADSKFKGKTKIELAESNEAKVKGKAKTGVDKLTAAKVKGKKKKVQSANTKGKGKMKNEVNDPTETKARGKAKMNVEEPSETKVKKERVNTEIKRLELKVPASVISPVGSIRARGRRSTVVEENDSSESSSAVTTPVSAVQSKIKSKSPAVASSPTLTSSTVTASGRPWGKKALAEATKSATPPKLHSNKKGKGKLPVSDSKVTSEISLPEQKINVTPEMFSVQQKRAKLPATKDSIIADIAAVQEKINEMPGITVQPKRGKFVTSDVFTVQKKISVTPEISVQSKRGKLPISVSPIIPEISSVQQKINLTPEISSVQSKRGKLPVSASPLIPEISEPELKRSGTPNSEETVPAPQAKKKRLSLNRGPKTDSPAFGRKKKQLALPEIMKDQDSICNINPDISQASKEQIEDSIDQYKELRIDEEEKTSIEEDENVGIVQNKVDINQSTLNATEIEQEGSEPSSTEIKQEGSEPSSELKSDAIQTEDNNMEKEEIDSTAQNSDFLDTDTIENLEGETAVDPGSEVLVKAQKKKKKHFRGLSYSFGKKKKKPPTGASRGRRGFSTSRLDMAQETDSVVSEDLDMDSIDSSSQDIPSDQFSQEADENIVEDLPLDPVHNIDGDVETIVKTAGGINAVEDELLDKIPNEDAMDDSVDEINSAVAVIETPKESEIHLAMVSKTINASVMKTQYTEFYEGIDTDGDDSLLEEEQRLLRGRAEVAEKIGRDSLVDKSAKKKIEIRVIEESESNITESDMSQNVLEGSAIEDEKLSCNTGDSMIEECMPEKSLIVPQEVNKEIQSISLEDQMQAKEGECTQLMSIEQEDKNIERDGNEEEMEHREDNLLEMSGDYDLRLKLEESFVETAGDDNMEEEEDEEIDPGTEAVDLYGLNLESQKSDQVLGTEAITQPKSVFQSKHPTVSTLENSSQIAAGAEKSIASVDVYEFNDSFEDIPKPSRFNEKKDVPKRMVLIRQPSVSKMTADFDNSDSISEDRMKGLSYDSNVEDEMCESHLEKLPLQSDETSVIGKNDILEREIPNMSDPIELGKRISVDIPSPVVEPQESVDYSEIASRMGSEPLSSSVEREVVSDLEPLCTVVQEETNADLDQLNTLPQEEPAIGLEQSVPQEGVPVMESEHVNVPPQERTALPLGHLNTVPQEETIMSSEHLNAVPLNKTVAESEHYNTAQVETALDPEYLDTAVQAERATGPEYLNTAVNPEHFNIDTQAEIPVDSGYFNTVAQANTLMDLGHHNTAENIPSVSVPMGDTVQEREKQEVSEHIEIPLAENDTTSGQTVNDHSTEDIMIHKPLPINDHFTRGKRRISVNKRRFEDLGYEGQNSDSSDSVGESRSASAATLEGIRKSKRLSRNSSPHPLAFTAPRSPEGAGSGASKPVPSQSSNVAAPSLTNILCKCQVREAPVAVGIDEEVYCQGVDSFDGRMIGCCNVVTDHRYLRVSGKIPFMLLCNIHRERLRRHNCCPWCGLFCTQGNFNECNWDPNGIRHYYHKYCSLVLDKTQLCPHCGSDNPPKEVHLELKMNRKPVVYLKQQQERKATTARMTWNKKDKITPVTTEPEEIPEGEPSILMKESTITAHKLPLGVERRKLQNAIRSINAGKVINTKPSGKAIYWSCKNNDLEKLLHVLVSGLNPNIRIKEYGNQTGLHVAASFNVLAAVHALVLSGATLDKVDSQLNSPLMVAITKQHNEIVKYMIQAGASLLAKNQEGMTPLHLAAKCGNFVACQYIVDSGRLTRHSINAVDEGGWTALVWASENGFINVVKFLLERGGNPQLCDVEQNTALHWAAFSGSTQICAMLLDRGCSLRSMNAHGDTPLHIAARQNHADAVVLFLARGARIDSLNSKSQTPIECSVPDSDVFLQLNLNNKLLDVMTQNNYRTEKILSSDIAAGKEAVPIPCVNGMDDDQLPLDYLYIAENCEASNVSIDRTITSMKWCECQDGCNSDCCGCGQLNFQCWYDPEGRLLPNFSYTDPPMIFECNRACRCNKLSCNNRVVQHGISAHMQLFKTDGKGWGVRALKTIEKGSYVCEYVGEIITDLEADQREDDSYLFDLDNRDSETFCIDARGYGNIARFINHLCEPNLTPVKVFIDHQDLVFPRIALFANRDIEPDEELGFDYGEKFWIIKYKHFTCTCASVTCKYSSETIYKTLENYNKRNSLLIKT